MWPITIGTNETSEVGAAFTLGAATVLRTMRTASAHQPAPVESTVLTVMVNPPATKV